ncbi:hypothetical protein L596_017417 [Steinernema carpocapsae]|uniref:Uncharacterized protein n=1 Tax=Steinernema carpocapsae TaxID=34508 RepID=A0A4U5N2B3_STECR|nr:hypothetical protein L596_017417 [Steinernema carpocapsae]
MAQVPKLQNILLRQFAVNDNSLEAWRFLPFHVATRLARIRADILLFQRLHENFVKFPRDCTELDPETGMFDPEKSIKSAKEQMDILDYFRVCTVNDLHEECHEVWHSLTDYQRVSLMSDTFPIMAAAVELWNNPLHHNHSEIINYCASVHCAEHGWIPALVKHLRRVEEVKLPSTITECLNRALRQRHFHVVFYLSTKEEFASKLMLDRIESGFFLIFPDGQIGTYFASKLFAMAACVPGLRPVAATLLHCLHENDRQKLRARLVDVDSKRAISGYDIIRKQFPAMLKVN